MRYSLKVVDALEDLKQLVQEQIFEEEDPEVCLEALRSMIMRKCKELGLIDDEEL